jgi:predicted transcriptional regulator
MAAITVKISDAWLEKLQQLAKQRGVSPEELLTANVDEDRFAQLANDVLKKNAELYRRLA